MSVTKKEIDEFVSRLMDETPGPNYRKVVGRNTWYLQDQLAKKYGCGSCQPGAQLLFNGSHDVINVKTGKKPYDMQNFIKFVAFVNAMAYKADVKKHPEYHSALANALKLKRFDEARI